MKSSDMLYLALAFASNSEFLWLRASQQQQQELHSQEIGQAGGLASAWPD